MNETVNQLMRPFAPDEHEVRVLQETRGGKVKWLVYIQRDAITRRLNEIYGLSWAMEIRDLRENFIETVDKQGEITRDHYAICILRLTLDGVSHDDAGEGSGNTPGNNNKSAVTDALKRTFSSFGGGLYLTDAPDLWSDGFRDNNNNVDYKKRDAYEKEVLAKVKTWVSGLIKTTAPTPGKPASENGAQNGTEGKLDVPLLMKTAFEKYRLGSVQVLAKLGVKDIRDFTGTFDEALALCNPFVTAAQPPLMDTALVNQLAE